MTTNYLNDDHVKAGKHLMTIKTINIKTIDSDRIVLEGDLQTNNGETGDIYIWLKHPSNNVMFHHRRMLKELCHATEVFPQKHGDFQMMVDHEVLAEFVWVENFGRFMNNSYSKTINENLFEEEQIPNDWIVRDNPPPAEHPTDSYPEIPQWEIERRFGEFKAELDKEVAENFPLDKNPSYENGMIISQSGLKEIQTHISGIYLHLEKLQKLFPDLMQE